jgi:hypothetical protein
LEAGISVSSIDVKILFENDGETDATKKAFRREILSESLFYLSV